MGNTRREMEKKETEKLVYSKLLFKPMTFTELKDETPLARATLSNHLKNLLKQGKIKRIWNKKRVYQVIFDEKQMMTEMKAFSLELLLELFEETEPTMAKTWKAFTECLMKEAIYFKKREMLGEPRLSAKELFIKTFEIMDSTIPSELQGYLAINIKESLKELDKKPADSPEFQEFERIRKSVEQRIRLKKVKSNERS